MRNSVAAQKITNKDATASSIGGASVSHAGKPKKAASKKKGAPMTKEGKSQGVVKIEQGATQAE